MLVRCCTRAQVRSATATVARSSALLVATALAAGRSCTLLPPLLCRTIGAPPAAVSHAHSHRGLSSVAAPQSDSAVAEGATAGSDGGESAGPQITEALINSYADRKARSVSLLEVIQMGSNPAYLLTAAQWLWTELPVRLAKRLRDLDDLPFGLSKSPEVRHLARLYTLSLQDALAFPQPTNSAEEALFTEQVLKRILLRHQAVTVDLASGINGGFLGKSLGTGGGAVVRPLKQHFLLQEFLDRWNSARIGLRLLMSQHVALHTPREGFVGVIELQCDPARVVAQAAADATAVCRAWSGLAPRVQVHDMAAGSGGIRFSYVTAHLRCMLFELLKNAMKATVEHAQRKRAAAAGGTGTGAAAAAALSEADLPPISVVLVDSATPSGDVTIKVSDRGGGIKRADLPLVFSYAFSASQKNIAQQQQLQEKMRQAMGAANAQTHAATPAGQAAAAGSAAAGAPIPAATAAATAGSATASNSNSNSNSSSASASSSPSPAPSPPSGWASSNYDPVLNIAHDDLGEAFGLPITRLYARYLGGDLQLYSLAGHGTDAYLFLSKSQSNFHEIIQD